MNNAIFYIGKWGPAYYLAFHFFMGANLNLMCLLIFLSYHCKISIHYAVITDLMLRT